MTNKIKIKMGDIEIDFEGTEETFKAALPHLFSEVRKLIKETPSKETSVVEERVPQPNVENEVIPGTLRIQMTTENIASILKCDSGMSLVMAACASLTFSGGKKTFTRKEILDEMKTATSCFKRSFVNNFTRYLSNLVRDGKLMDKPEGNYALSAEAKSSLTEQLSL